MVYYHSAFLVCLNYIVDFSIITSDVTYSVISRGMLSQV